MELWNIISNILVIYAIIQIVLNKLSKIHDTKISHISIICDGGTDDSQHKEQQSIEYRKSIKSHMWTIFKKIFLIRELEQEYSINKIIKEDNKNIIFYLIMIPLIFIINLIIYLIYI